MKNSFSRKNTAIPKFMMLGGVVFLLIIFINMIQNVIHERAGTRAEAVRSVQDAVAGAQTITGPILYQSCLENWTETVKEEKQAPVTHNRRREFTRTVTPIELTVASGIDVGQRSRSLYQTNVLNAKMRLRAQFRPDQFPPPLATEKGSTTICETPVAILGVSDPRGIRSTQATFNGTDQSVNGGTPIAAIKRGMHVGFPSEVFKLSSPWTIDWTIEFAATERIGVVPLGEKTSVSMSSPWPHPSFVGRFAPVERELTESGFTANWRLSSVATDAGRSIREGNAACEIGSITSNGCAETIFVAFVDPINVYSLSDRATKYGLLFVVLTFVAVGLFEVMKKLRVHPIQYLLVGAAICVFFLLLISLSEHLGFAAAYTCGAVATTLLLGYYASHILGSARLGAPFAALIAALYALLYVLLQLEQTALVVGAIGLFIALAAVMIATRRVDWHAMFATPSPSSSSDDDEHQTHAI